MDLKPVREEIDKIDNAIRYLLVFRMALIPLVTKIKIENGIELHQPGREEAIYNSIKEFAKDTGIDSDLVIEVYKSIIKKALEIEADGIKKIAEVDDDVMQEYEKLDKILGTDIPQVINNIMNLSEDKLSEIASGIYERRLKKWVLII